MKNETKIPVQILKESLFKYFFAKNKLSSAERRKKLQLQLRNVFKISFRNEAEG